MSLLYKHLTLQTPVEQRFFTKSIYFLEKQITDFD